MERYRGAGEEKRRRCAAEKDRQSKIRRHMGQLRYYVLFHHRKRYDAIYPVTYTRPSTPQSPLASPAKSPGGMRSQSPQL